MLENAKILPIGLWEALDLWGQMAWGRPTLLTHKAHVVHVKVQRCDFLHVETFGDYNS